MISACHLWKKYGEVWALRGLSFEVSPGSVFGLIGPNGAGKTTAIRILATSLMPTSGDAFVCDHSAVREPLAVRPLLGFMPESFALYDDLQVWEYLDFFAAAYHVRWSDRVRVVDEVIELTDLQKRRNDLLGTLSKGLRQRVLIAKSLVHDPKVLLLDEPASGLDPRARIELRSILRTLAEMGKSIVISSHILSELNEMCDAIGVMESGRMVVSGPVSEIEKQLQSARRVDIVFRGSPDTVREVLEKSETAAGVTVEEGRASFECRGDVEDRARIVAALVGAGVAVADFHERGQHLEELFLRVSSGEPT